jgi:hypothetical protein
MKKLLTILIAVVFCTAMHATTTNNYGWEDFGTILGQLGTNMFSANVTSGFDPDWPGTVTPRSGSHMLQLTETPHAGTPQAFVTWITNLVNGDEVTASFYGWDSTEGSSPSMRIWGHYTMSYDINKYLGSASGDSTYTTGTGEWSQVSYTWTFSGGGGATADALVVECRLYSTPSTGPESTDFWVDDEQVIAPDTSTVLFPIPEPLSLSVLVLGLGALFLRRK